MRKRPASSKQKLPCTARSGETARKLASVSSTGRTLVRALARAFIGDSVSLSPMSQRNRGDVATSRVSLLFHKFGDARDPRTRSAAPADSQLTHSSEMCDCGEEFGHPKPERSRVFLRISLG